MERHRGGEVSHSDDYMSHIQTNWNFDNHRENFSGDFHHHQHQHERPFHHRPHTHLDHRHQQNSFAEPNSSVGEGVDSNSNHSLPFWARKRQFSTDCSDGGSFVKLYVLGIPRTATEEDIRSVFGEHGHIVEVVLLKDKRTGQQQESCFVKYATLEEADRAVEALSGQYIFPGGGLPLKVKYADGERERLGNFFGAHVQKLYVGCLNREASKREIEEVRRIIFSPYGVVEDVFIVRNELKQSRGFAFIQFSRRDMAVAAMNALNGAYVMRGCDLPLIVRFADPKKPRTGDSMPRPFISGPLGGHFQPNNSTPLSQRVPPSSQSPQSKPQAVMFSCPASGQVLPPSTSAHAVSGAAEMEDSLDCDWSDHMCPDGYAYYYNCITCESRWEKPEEYALYEQQLEKLEQQQKQQETLRPEAVCSSEQVQFQSLFSQQLLWSSSSATGVIS